MIRSYVPRKAGLDVVINEILSSEYPLDILVRNHLFVPVEVLTCIGGKVSDAISLNKAINRLTNSDNRETTTYEKALDLTLDGGGNLSMQEDGDFGKPAKQEFYYIDVQGNFYNTSFTLEINSQEASTVAEKQRMVQSANSQEKGKYDHVKSLIFTDGKNNYMAVINGNERLDFTDLNFMVNGELTLAKPEEILKITGREIGAVSPLINQSNFRNIAGVHFSRRLLDEGYSKPHYEVVFSKNAAIVVSDMRDLLEILQSVGKIPHGFPMTQSFRNYNPMIASLPK